MAFDQKEWLKNQTKMYTVRIKKSDPLEIALEKASEYEQIQPVKYIKIALAEKLHKEGFLDGMVILSGRGRRKKY